MAITRRSSWPSAPAKKRAKRIKVAQAPPPETAPIGSGAARQAATSVSERKKKIRKRNAEAMKALRESRS